MRPAALWLLLATVYFFSAQLGLSLAFEQANTSPVWPPTGISIAALLYFGPRAWPGIFLGALLTNIMAGTSIPVSLGIATGNTLEGLVASYLLVRFASTYPFNKVRDVFIFVAVVLFATTISASIGVSSLLIGDVIEKDSFSLLWSTWWLGDLVGALVITPLLLCCSRLHNPRQYISQWLEALCLIILTILSSELVFNSLFHILHADYPIGFVLIPFAIWAAYRFQQYGATLFIALISILAIYGTLQGHGPFVRTSVNESLLLLQTFIGVIAATTFVLAASISEGLAANEKLRDSQVLLEQRVNQRTDALNVANLQLEAEINIRDKTADALHTLLLTIDSNSNHEFLRICMKNLATTFNTHYAFVGIFTDTTQTSIRTLAVWADGHIADNFNYDLQGTPCQDVLDEGMELVSTAAAEDYPEDELITQMGIVSYFGAPLKSSSNKVLGIVAVMDIQATSPQSWNKPILGLYAKHIAAELERTASQEELILAENVFHENVQAIIITDKEGTILRVNPAFTHITGYSSDDAVGQNPKLLSSGRHDEKFYQAFWSSILNIGYWQGEIWDRRKNGEIFPAWQTITAVRDMRGNIFQFISIFSDITEKKVSEEHIFHLAHYDIVTGLHNRAAFQELLEKAIIHAQRNKEQLALLYLDLDNFKLINDASGHAVGDMLLKYIATRMTDLMRKEDTIARLGGDEFVILLSNINTSQNAARIAGKVLSELGHPILLDNIEVVVTGSIGISTYPADGADTTTLLKNADAAMYRAKKNGRNNFQFFTSEMNAQAEERLILESDMRKALENHEFVLHYQPQADLQSGEIIACEALIRWQHPERGLIPPNIFIPIAEDSGLINPLFDWIIHSACKQHQLWQESGLPAMRIAVNMSARQFINQTLLLSTVKKAIEDSAIDPQYLELEITESIIMDNVNETIETLQAFRDMGIKLSIDDFGTGYSSMAYLKRLPLDKLKIDQSFVCDITTDPDDAIIVQTTIALGHNLHLDVIAEGVETEQQLEFLKDNGCDEIQGYYFSRPVPADELAELIRVKHKLELN